MLGLFDSGEGGLNTVRYLIASGLNEGLVHIIDRERAPYGIKTENELVGIVENNVSRLTDLGARKVLIACVTASTVHGLLDEKYKQITIPIIEPVARMAEGLSKNRRIGVIATERTVASHAFSEHIRGCEVFELAAQELVGMIDGGLSDNTATDTDVERIRELLSPLFTTETDTLILGCTHFPTLKGVIREILEPYGVKNIIDTAKIGADTLIKLHGCQPLL